MLSKVETEKLVGGESKRNERCCRSDGRHDGAFVSDASPLDRKPRGNVQGEDVMGRGQFHLAKGSFERRRFPWDEAEVFRVVNSL